MGRASQIIVVLTRFARNEVHIFLVVCYLVCFLERFSFFQNYVKQGVVAYYLGSFNDDCQWWTHHHICPCSQLPFEGSSLNLV